MTAEGHRQDRDIIEIVRLIDADGRISETERRFGGGLSIRPQPTMVHTVE
jgi:hypothetical protein